MADRPDHPAGSTKLPRSRGGNPPYRRGAPAQWWRSRGPWAGACRRGVRPHCGM